MNSNNPIQRYRWVLLRHIGALDDLRGIHFDFLLEDQKCCRSWRLSDIPLVDGPLVNAVFIAPHALEWLDIQEKVLSRNRGVATRIKKGIFFKSPQSFQQSSINLSLTWDDLEVKLLIDNNACRISSKK